MALVVVPAQARSEDLTFVRARICVGELSKHGVRVRTERTAFYLQANVWLPGFREMQVTNRPLSLMMTVGGAETRGEPVVEIFDDETFQYWRPAGRGERKAGCREWADDMQERDSCPVAATDGDSPQAEGRAFAFREVG